LPTAFKWFVSLVVAIGAAALDSMAASAKADRVVIAVATNFAEAATTLAREFEKGSDHKIELAFGSTGKLYAQIRAGAPYDIFLAADQERPRKLVAEGHGVDGSRFTYAIGQVTLWSADGNRVQGDPKSVLVAPTVRTIAIANPALAPYGAAGRQVLAKLGVLRAVTPRIVMGENIGQAFALIATGNADLGFVARALLEGRRGAALGGSRWDVPSEMHDPLKQDAVQLVHGSTNKGATAFLAYLKSADARAIVAKLGYLARME
jgi:molybdate transport system substrate-binding protein